MDSVRRLGARHTGGMASNPTPSPGASAPTPSDPRPAATPGNQWDAAVTRDAAHAKRYAERWRRLAAEGKDILGEARLIDAMAARGSLILDAGCGTGRLAAHLLPAGHRVVGVDLDPELIAIARTDHPAARFETQNLARLDLLDDQGERLRADLAVSAGNVVAFFAEAERRPALERLREHLVPGGRLVVGFGSGRGYAVEDFLADADASGFDLHHRFSTWDLRPPAEDFLVAVLGRR